MSVCQECMCVFVYVNGAQMLKYEVCAYVRTYTTLRRSVCVCVKAS